MSEVISKKLLKVFFSFTLIFLWIASFAFAPAPPDVKAKLAKISVPFIENKGQYPKEVKFYAKTFGGTVFVTKNGEIVYSLPKYKKAKNKKDKAVTGGGVGLREKLVGVEKTDVKGVEKAITKVNIFEGKDPKKWKRDLSTYKAVSLGEVYKGVELKLRAHGNNVEKLFCIKPEANPNVVRLKVEGGKGIEIAKDGTLIVKTALGNVKFTKPLAYQEKNGKKQYVNVSYLKLSDKEYGFKLGKYDRTKPLVIDPLLASTFLGGSSNDWANAIALDSSGNVYVTGKTNSPNFPITPGAYNTNYYSVFISKLDSSLSHLLASTFLGGVGYDEATAIALDSSGNVYVTGYTGSSNFPTTPEAYDATWSAYNDIFISKLDNSLSHLLASTYLGGSGDDYAYTMALDSSGNVYIAGETSSGDFPVTPGAYNACCANSFISKLDSSLSHLIASALLGDGEIHAVTLDSSGNVYVAGYTWSSDFPTTPGAHDTSFNGGGHDIFISKLNSSLTQLLASTYLGGGGDDDAYAIALDNSGNVYVTGETSSPYFPTTVGAYDTSWNGDRDIFISKLNSSLTQLLASTYLGGSDDDGFPAVTLDSSGNVYVAGYTWSSDFPTTPGAYDTSNVGSFISKLDSSLTQLIASTYFGSGANINAITIDKSCNIYIAGGAWPDLPTTSGAYNTSCNGGQDIFISKLDKNLSSATYSTYTLTVTKQGSGSGTVSAPEIIMCGDMCSAQFEDGDQITLNATPDPGSTFVGWGGDCSGCGNNATCQITMDSDKTCIAEFEAGLIRYDFNDLTGWTFEDDSHGGGVCSNEYAEVKVSNGIAEIHCHSSYSKGKLVHSFDNPVPPSEISVKYSYSAPSGSCGGITTYVYGEDGDELTRWNWSFDEWFSNYSNNYLMLFGTRYDFDFSKDYGSGTVRWVFDRSSNKVQFYFGDQLLKEISVSPANLEQKISRIELVSGNSCCDGRNDFYGLFDYVEIKEGSSAPPQYSFTPGNDTNFIHDTTLKTIGAGAGNDVYILDPNYLSNGQYIIIMDRDGNNVIRLATGLQMSKIKASKNSVEFILSNGAVVDLLYANQFRFDIGGNELSGQGSIQQSFYDFVTSSLGLSGVPTSYSDIETVSGNIQITDSGLQVTSY